MHNFLEQSLILLVDDNVKNLQVLGTLLEGKYRTAVAKDGLKALKFVEEMLPDLILLDIMMPEMDGYTVCQKIKASDKIRDIPIILLTAKTDAEDIVKGFEAGAVDYVTKPVHKEELLARIKTHLTLQQTRKELKMINQTKDKFFSIIAHDLRSPFSGFLEFTQILLQDFDDFDREEIKEYLFELQKSSKTMYALIENLLTWARLNQGLIQFTPQHVILHELIEQTIELFSFRALQKKIALINQVDRNITAFLDSNIISTVLRNLISNALKFTFADGTIKISAHEDNKYIHIAFSDTGIGMSDDDLLKLFRIDVKFFNIGTERETGTGLGLILCKELIEKHGGAIWAESTVGEGTTFRFSLPKGKG